jgi:hypothetical protein
VDRLDCRHRAQQAFAERHVGIVGALIRLAHFADGRCRSINEGAFFSGTRCVAAGAGSRSST